MDQLPHSRPEGFTNNALFADSQQQFNAYDNLLHSAGHDLSPYDNNWGVNPSNYALPHSRAQAQSPSWASHNNANHGLHGHIGNVNGQPSPYSRPVSQSPAPYGQQAYGSNSNSNFQYQQGQSQYDPALFQQPHGQNLNYSSTNYQTPNTGTIAPQALQHDARSLALGDKPNFQTHPSQQRPSAFSNNVVDQHKLIGNIPTGADAGLFSIINFDSLARATNTTRMGIYANVGNEPMNWDCNRAALPAYVPRRSRNELRRSAGSDSRLLAKIGKKSTKMQRIAIAPKTQYAASVAFAHSAENIKYEGQPSSDEESSSDDDDESSYTSDDESEPVPLPLKRPDSATGSTEYDTIKALWRPNRKSLSSDSIRKGLVDFWEIAKTVRDRWKADANAFEEAKKKGQKSQLPLLESRVKDQRDMIEVAFKAALKHGHRSIVEIMSENESLIYVCYQFLLDRVKAEDYNSPLSRTILELMTIWVSLTEERVQKTHINKVLVRYAKYGDAKTKYYVNKITANAATASKEAKEKVANAPAKRAASAEAKAGSPTQRHAEPVAGVKRSASTAIGEGNAAKKVATGVTKPNGVATAAKANGVVRKVSGAADAAKLAAAPGPATKTKSVVAKPSGIFSSLSAAKRPGTSTASKAATTGASTASKLAEKKTTTTAPKSTFSFAETMANLNKPKEEKPAQAKPEKQLPPETPDEKARRLRKESRRHLRVSFKRDDELVETRFFTHDPDEELGHDAGQMRDISDVGGEGRMFKQQHNMMEVDEDDDTHEEDDKNLVAFREPGLIDFKDVDREERARNYKRRGGGQLDVESKERADRDYYDANNLIVFYTMPEDIPPNPREPSNPYSGQAVENARHFALPEEKYAARARQTRAEQVFHSGAQQQYPAQSAPSPQFDLSRFTGLANQQPNMQQPQAPATAEFDIKSILANLQPANTNVSTPPPQQLPNFPPNFQPPPPMMSGMQPPQHQHQQPPQPQIPVNVDLASLLAQIGNNGGATQPPAMGGGYGMPGAPPPVGFGQPYANNQPQSQWQQQAGGQGGVRGDNRMTPETRNNPATNKKYKTKICQFWQKGTCQKGDSCSYKHSND